MASGTGEKSEKAAFQVTEEFSAALLNRRSGALRFRTVEPGRMSAVRRVKEQGVLHRSGSCAGRELLNRETSRGFFPSKPSLP